MIDLSWDHLPLGAYALSRFKPPRTYKILLLLMATMAFPGEVTMIPAFLLLKRFPLWPLLGAADHASGRVAAAGVRLLRSAWG
jgi:ABC-type glycerol-3-phosphate transport system permease component